MVKNDGIGFLVVSRIELSSRMYKIKLLKAHRMVSAYAVPRWFRPGSGWYDEQMVAILRKHSHCCALGTVYPFDTHNPSSWLARKVILGMAEPGRIILLHDSGRRGRRAVKTLEAVLPILAQRGYRICSFSEMVAHGHESTVHLTASEESSSSLIP